MTVDELKQTMNNVIGILQDNKKIVTPDLLDGIDKVVQSLTGPAPQVDFSTDFQNSVKNIGAVVDMEKRLISGNMTADLIEILTKIQNRPIIMRLIAHVV